MRSRVCFFYACAIRLFYSSNQVGRDLIDRLDLAVQTNNEGVGFVSLFETTVLECLFLFYDIFRRALCRIVMCIPVVSSQRNLFANKNFAPVKNVCFVAWPVRL
jgi:hypothetical protein